MDRIINRSFFEEAKEFFSKKENKKMAVLIIAGVFLLIVLQTAKGIGDGKKYIVSEDGTVIGLMRDSVDQEAVFPLTVEATRGNIKTKRDVMLDLKARATAMNDEEIAVADTGVVELESALDSMIRNVEEGAGIRVMLPLSDEDISYEWRKENSRTNYALLLMIPMLLIVLVENDRKRTRDRAKARCDEIRTGLPAFNDRILLLMNCGLIFHDAFFRITESYAIRGKKGVFGEMLADIGRKSSEFGRPVERVITEQAVKEGVREFSRVAGVISDSQHKGTDLTKVLEQESRALWESRKRLAEEKGRIAETKLTLPLAVLLIVLILITAAPAILQVEGG
ncbi:MAG: type II secretion system F family protein [Eubacterium sp.]|nr:type II secretion system F family protein [Eubacterium sp.]